MIDASHRSANPGRPAVPPRPSLRVSIIAGLAAVVLGLGVGAALVLTATPEYTATTSVVVLPKSGLPTGTSASYYETLSDGQIVGTYAEVANNAGFQSTAEQSIGLSASQRSALTATVSVVPNTSVLLVTVKSGEAGVAERVAESVAGSTVSYVSALAGPYRAQVLGDGQAPASRTSASPATVLVLALIVALVGGIVVQQIVYQVMAVVAARRPASTVTRLTPKERQRSEVVELPDAAEAP